MTTREIEQILRNQLIGRIGCYAGGKIYVVPVAFAFDGAFIYGHSRDGLKVKMMRQNPKVCFEVDVVDDLNNWKSVIVQGVYEELIGEPARTAIDFFIRKLQPHLKKGSSLIPQELYDFHRKEQSSLKTIIYRIKIVEKTGRCEKI